MCGINGIYAYRTSAVAPQRSELIATRDYMRERGPDGEGEWWSEDGRIGLGHRRLSILDLSSRGSQPMVSKCGRYVITFNGEIYNYPDLRRGLEQQGRHFVSDTDTEVILYLFEDRGLAAVKALRGMFAFAIWDNLEQRLFLARDPYGIKPLYYAEHGGILRFASQVKALLSGKCFGEDPNPAGLVGFLLWGSVPEPHTLYRQIKSVPAGAILRIDRDGAHQAKLYSSVHRIIADSGMQPAPTPLVNEIVRQAARESVQAHLLADVPVGLFLSAGIDSGALLGLMRDSGAPRIQAITLGFREFAGTAADETILAGEVARHYGAEHFVRIIDRNEFEADLPELMLHMDQPSIDGVNIWFVAKAAHEAGLKVALSGVGGDEILAGYPSFTQIPRLVRWQRCASSIPGADALLSVVLRAIASISNRPKLAGLRELGGTFAGAYLLRRGLFMPWELAEVIGDPAIIKEGWGELDPLGTMSEILEPGMTSTSRVATLESTHYLRHQLLRDADWAGMAHSIEVRTPLVDIELLSALAPVTAVLRGREGKAALAQSPQLPLPGSISRRSKTGFGVPTASWLGSAGGKITPSTARALGNSRSWAKHVLSESVEHTKAGPILGLGASANQQHCETTAVT